MTRTPGDYCTARDLDLTRQVASDYGQLHEWPAWRIAEFETHYANHCEEHGLAYVEHIARPFAAERDLPIKEI